MKVRTVIKTEFTISHINARTKAATPFNARKKKINPKQKQYY